MSTGKVNFRSHHAAAAGALPTCHHSVFGTPLRRGAPVCRQAGARLVIPHDKFFGLTELGVFLLVRLQAQRPIEFIDRHTLGLASRALRTLSAREKRLKAPQGSSENAAGLMVELVCTRRVQLNSAPVKKPKKRRSAMDKRQILNPKS